MIAEVSCAAVADCTIMPQDGYLCITIWTWIASVTFPPCVYLRLCVCVCFSVRVWSTSGPVLSFFFLLSRSLSLSLSVPVPISPFLFSLGLFPRLPCRWYRVSVSLLTPLILPLGSAWKLVVRISRSNLKNHPASRNSRFREITRALNLETNCEVANVSFIVRCLKHRFMTGRFLITFRFN